jgi:hypothetical protein
MKTKKQTLSILSIFLFFAATYNTIAQDLVVTSKNDSINARITKIKKDILYFYFVKNGEVRSTLLPLKEVQAHQKNFYLTAEVPKDYKPTNSYTGPKYRIALNGGLSYLTAKTSSSVPEALRDHDKQLKSGVHWGANLHYLTSEYFGFGLKYSTFYSSHTEQNVIITMEDDSVLYGIKDTDYIHFVGPSVLYKIVSPNGKNAWIFKTSIGYLAYKQEQQIGNRNFTITAATLGLNLDFGYDIYLSKKLSLGLLASIVSGGVDEVELKENGVSQTVELDERGSLSRIDLSVGLRWVL